MRITELAEATGVAPATVKYYVREGLLPAGTRVSDNRTDYDDEHARRVRLVRALIDVGQLPVARAREVLAVLDADARRVQEVFAVAQDALTPGPSDADPPPADALARVDADADLAAVRGRPDRTAMAELMVVGTVLGDQLAAGLRRIAQATVSSSTWATTGGAP